MENLNNIDWNRREKELRNSFSHGKVPNSFRYEELLRRIGSEDYKLFYNREKNIFRNLWLAYSRLGSICITVFGKNLYDKFETKVFPDPERRIFVEYKVQDFSVENLRNIVLSQI